MLIHPHIAYHDYEGVAVNDTERVTLGKDLADKSIMILRNHGVLTTGSSIAEGFTRLFYVTKAACFSYGFCKTTFATNPCKSIPTDTNQQTSNKTTNQK